MLRTVLATRTLQTTDLSLVGGNGNDTLTGSDIAEAISGLGGDDLIRGRAGDDAINGGAGDDEIDGGAGNDVIQGGAGNDLITDYEGYARVDGGAGNDSLFGLDGELRGGAGDDYLDGEVLYGGTGQDLLFGGLDASRLNGGAGNDALVAYALGNDTMTGGAGADQFLFAISDRGVDIVTDFDATEDVLNLQDFGITQDGIYAYASQSGADTVITIDKGETGTLTIVLLNVDATDLIL
jgi:Ca2+-binding RTX toxin-like protein